MKKILFLFLLISTSGFTQNNLNGLWKIDEIIGLYSTDEYNLSPAKEDESLQGWRYGNSVTFNPNGTFNSRYSAWCGNDCFPHSKGTFEKIDETHIRLKLDVLEITGDCPYSIDSTHHDLGIFLIKKTENGYRLIKSDFTTSDKQQEKYSEMLTDLSIINMDDSFYKEVRLSPNTREKKDVEILATGLKNISGFEPEKAKLLYAKYQSHQKRFVFEYKSRLLLALYNPGPSQFILYDIKKKSDL